MIFNRIKYHEKYLKSNAQGIIESLSNDIGINNYKRIEKEGIKGTNNIILFLFPQQEIL